MKYICKKDFPGLSCVVGDIIDIERKDGDKMLIDGACLTDKSVVREFFELKRLEGWKYSPYSFSKMDSWQQCPKKFEYNYIIKPPRVEVPNPILEKGTLFHGLLEYATIDKLHEFEMEDEFKALTTKDAEKIINQAFNFIETSNDYKWIKAIKGLKITEQEMFLGNKLQPVEHLEDALIRGFIDLLIYDEKTNSCYIFDWKTGGKSKENLLKWPKPKDQLELYAIWANQVFDVKFIETAFVYVEQNHMAKYTFNEHEITYLIKKFEDKIDNIENDKNFPKNLTQLCAWCDFKELCLGIDAKRDPRSITKEEIFDAGKGTPKQNRRNLKNEAFLNKIKTRASN